MRMNCPRGIGLVVGLLLAASTARAQEEKGTLKSFGEERWLQTLPKEHWARAPGVKEQLLRMAAQMDADISDRRDTPPMRLLFKDPKQVSLITEGNFLTHPEQWEVRCRGAIEACALVPVSAHWSTYHMQQWAANDVHELHQVSVTHNPSKQPNTYLPKILHQAELGAHLELNKVPAGGRFVTAVPITIQPKHQQTMIYYESEDRVNKQRGKWEGDSCQRAILFTRPATAKAGPR